MTQPRKISFHGSIQEEKVVLCQAGAVPFPFSCYHGKKFSLVVSLDLPPRERF